MVVFRVSGCSPLVERGHIFTTPLDATMDDEESLDLSVASGPILHHQSLQGRSNSSMNLVEISLWRGGLVWTASALVVRPFFPMLAAAVPLGARPHSPQAGLQATRSIEVDGIPKVPEVLSTSVYK